MLGQLTYFTKVLSIVGDIIKIRAKGIGLGDLALVENWDGERSLAQVIEIQQDEASLQVFPGGRGYRPRYVFASLITARRSPTARTSWGVSLTAPGSPSMVGLRCRVTHIWKSAGRRSTP